MKRANISNNVIRRLPRYLRKLDDLSAKGGERISSGERYSFFATASISGVIMPRFA